MSEIIAVTDEEIAALTQSILTRYGIDFTCYEPQSLKRRIVRLLNVYNFRSIHEMWVRILREREFMSCFMNEVSVGMTSMFRDPIVWKQLKGILNSQYKDSSSISIWHAGCSSGEEVFTMGILLEEINLLEKTSALATDINQDALEIGRKGEYHKIKMIDNEKNFKLYNPFGDLSVYYSRVDSKMGKMDQKLSKHVKFAYHNLISDKFTGGFDIILCRNVMIYFDSQAKKMLMQKFYESLSPGGYFIIGFYDTMLSMIDQKLFSLVDEEAKIFRKVG